MTADGGGVMPATGRWAVVREIWEALPVLLVADLLLTIGLVPALVLWNLGGPWLVVTAVTVPSCWFWTWAARRFDPAAGAGARAAWWPAVARAGGAGLALGAVVTSATLAWRWAAAGSAVALAAAAVTTVEAVAAGVWTLSALRLVARGAATAAAVRAGLDVLRRRPGVALLVGYEAGLVVVLVIVFGIWGLVLIPGPVAVIAVRQLAGRETTPHDLARGPSWAPAGDPVGATRRRPLSPPPLTSNPRRVSSWQSTR